MFAENIQDIPTSSTRRCQHLHPSYSPTGLTINTRPPLKQSPPTTSRKQVPPRATDQTRCGGQQECEEGQNIQRGRIRDGRVKEGVLRARVSVAKLGKGRGRTGITNATRTSVGIRCEWMLTESKWISNSVKDRPRVHTGLVVPSEERQYQRNRAGFRIKGYKPRIG